MADSFDPVAAPQLNSLDNLELAGKRVLVRADLNVPVEEGAVADSRRIEAAAETIRDILDAGGTPVVISHLGRPKGKADPALTLKPIVAPLSRTLGGATVRLAADCIGMEAQSVIDGLRAGQVALLENLRFHPGEEENDPEFAGRLAALADLYVNDAFSASHRAHASIVALAERLPAAAGRLMMKELTALNRWLDDPEYPLLVILGGAKVKTKLGVAEALLRRGADVVVAGAMANTVLSAHGREVGKSIREDGMHEDAVRLVQVASESGHTLIVPTDAVVAPDVDSSRDSHLVSVEDIPADEMILDIGPESVDAIFQLLDRARTVVWNGPLGAAEHEAFALSTLTVAGGIAHRTEQKGLKSVIGGGDTIAILGRGDLLRRFTYASMAGGAFLAWLEGKPLPGVEALKENRRAMVGQPAGN